MPLFTPIGGGGGIGKATVSATTGSPTVDTSSRAGKTIYKFTGSGSITVDKAGTAEILVIGGGGGGARYAGAGGAGGYIYDTSALLKAGTLTVTVGAGALGGTNTPNSNYGMGNNGYASRIDTYVAVGGGMGYANTGSQGARDIPGGSGGGAGDNGANGSSGTPGQGNSGGANGGGGGGGAGGAGQDATSGNANGGAGATNSITGTSVTYAGGGASGSGTATGGGGSGSAGAGAANKGGGGSGGTSYSVGGAGGSGYVVIVIG